jgi:hypothetical protein
MVMQSLSGSVLQASSLHQPLCPLPAPLTETHILLDTSIDRFDACRRRQLATKAARKSAPASGVSTLYGSDDSTQEEEDEGSRPTLNKAARKSAPASGVSTLYGSDDSTQEEEAEGSRPTGCKAARKSAPASNLCKLFAGESDDSSQREEDEDDASESVGSAMFVPIPPKHKSADHIPPAFQVTSSSVVVVGRGAKADVKNTDVRVSSKHCTLELFPDDKSSDRK